MAKKWQELQRNAEVWSYLERTLFTSRVTNSIKKDIESLN